MKDKVAEGKARVLLVESDPCLVEVAQHLLGPEGFSTLVASSGEEALQILRDGQEQPGPVDLVLLDVMMPGLNGCEVCRFIKDDTRLKHIPVIMVTTLDNVEERVASLEAGADDWITKPFCREELVARLRARLRMSEMERETARLYQESESWAAQFATVIGKLERRLDEVQALFTVGQSLVTTLNLDKVLSLIVDAALRTIPVAHKAVIHFLDETNGVLVPRAVSHHGQGVGSSAKMRLGKGVAGRVVVEKSAIYVSDTRVDPRFVDSGTAVKSLLVVPMILGETVVGTLSVDSGEAEAFTQDDERLLVMLANQAAIAIENARLYGEAKRADELAALNRIATAMVSTLDLDQVLTLAMQGINETLRVEAGSLLLLNEAEDELVPKMTLCGEKSVRGEMTLSLGQGVAGWVVQQGKPLLLPNTRQENRLPSTTAQLLGIGARSVLCVPLVLREKTIGAIEVINRWGGKFTEDDVTLLNSIAASVAIAIENARLYTEVKDFADELARSQAQLIQSEKLAATGKLAASIAHELNNPLQAVQGCIYLVADQIDSGDSNRQYLDIAREELGRMARIVGRMVDFYRPSNEGRIPTDVNALLDNVIALVRKRLQQEDIEVDLNLAPDLPLIEATGDHLKQVFLNMVINALEAMPRGGRLEVATRYISKRDDRTKTSADGGFVEIEFADTGVGIPAEHIPNIFDPFFTTKSKGMGLGLSVSYGIVERHRGRIQVKSKVGEGTTFIVRLPVEGDR